MGELLGSGQTGKVFQAVHRKTAERVAIKVFGPKGKALGRVPWPCPLALALSLGLVHRPCPLALALSTALVPPLAFPYALPL